MSRLADPRVAEFYAETYDEAVPDWPGEMDFYRAYAHELKGSKLLDVACGTGRIGIRLAQEGTPVTGLDLSQKMLEVARQKSTGMANIRWVHANMCGFDLGETFGLAIIGGHAFQNLNMAQEQVDCLECIHRHLAPGGRLIVHLDHQDFAWLGGLVGDKGGVFEPAEQFRHPRTGHQIRAFRAWAYEPATQTATCKTSWEAVGADGKIVDRWESEPVPLHCIFRFEMEHLLARTRFKVEAVYGDFFRHQLENKSPGMIWVSERS